MSDESNDRMARATRIRQMREGQRPDDEADEAGEEATGGDVADRDMPEAPSDVEDSRESDSVEATPEDTETPDGDAGDQGQEEDGVTESPVAAGDAAETENPEATSDAGTDQPLDDEAAAAARRAAQSAAQVTGTGTVEAVTQAGSGAGASAPEQSAGGAESAPSPGPTGVELPDQASIQSAVADEVLASAETGGTARSRGVERQGTKEETVRVLEFTLGAEHYCLDIDHVEEIVKRESITRVPNTPEYVEGVVDLRGQITTILNPKDLLDIEQDGPESLLVVFDPEGFEDQGAIGWVVDAVRQVVPVAESEISDPPIDEDYIEGVVDRDDEDEFVIWTNPEVAIRLAAIDGEDDGD